MEEEGEEGNVSCIMYTVGCVEGDRYIRGRERETGNGKLDLKRRISITANPLQARPIPRQAQDVSWLDQAD